ncbi:MAG: lysophospholipid acyltransferase family protein [Rhodobacteraceae bacterium]|nr:lysophospholipid acyltransferase family protein [Paracoccaceae bacterium]
MATEQTNWRDSLQNAALRGALGFALALPYRWRVPLIGWLVSRVVAPIAGWRRRIRGNLAHVCPDMDPAEVKRMTRAVPNNAGRTLIEIYSGREFLDRVKDLEPTGPGVAALREARAAGRPVILVTGHFGNYDAPRGALAAQGIPMAALYRPMRNAKFNAHYVNAMSTIASPVFPADRRGLIGLLKYLSTGNTIGVLIDIYATKGAKVSYFGKSAPTATSVAEWALKYDALLLPIYGIRLENGLDFEIRIDAPIPHTDPVTMTQALNDNLEALVRNHMDQWFWIHRRWKPGRQAGIQRKRAAASTGP